MDAYESSDLIIEGLVPLLVLILLIAVIRNLWTRYTHRKTVRDLVAKYQHILAKKRAQLLVEDDYGDHDPDKWIQEAQRFFTKKIEPHLDKNWEKYISGRKAGRMIEEAAVDFGEDVFRGTEHLRRPQLEMAA